MTAPSSSVSASASRSTMPASPRARSSPLLTWGLVIGLALFVGGAVGLGLGLGGFILPRCENLASRVALIGGGTVAIGLGLLIGLRQFVG